MILEKGPRSAILEIITGAIRWRRHSFNCEAAGKRASHRGAQRKGSAGSGADYPRCVRYVSWRPGPGHILDRSGLRVRPPARTSSRRLRRDARRETGRLQRCRQLGKRRLLRPADRASRLAGARHRAGIARPNHGAIRYLGNAAGRTIHLRAKPQAYRALSEARLLRALPHRAHGGTGAARANKRRVVALWRIDKAAAGRRPCTRAGK